MAGVHSNSLFHPFWFLLSSVVQIGSSVIFEQKVGADFQPTEKKNRLNGCSCE